MSMNGSGVFVVNSAGQPVVASTLITSAAFNAFTADVATALSTAIMKDGQTTVTANIPFAGYRLTGVGAASARTDAATLVNVQDGTGVYVGTVGGTADAITLTPSPAITAYTAGQTFYWIASGTNTTAVTVAVNGLAAKAITRNGTTALLAGDIASGAMVQATYDGTRFILAASSAVALSGGTMTGALVQAVGANVASASTINLTTVAGNACHVTGTTTITAVTLATGKFCEVIFDGILTLTHHTTNNNLPSAANITTAAGDRAAYWSDGTTVYCLRYQRANGTAVVGLTAGQLAGTATNDNASTGNVGEYLSSSVSSGSPVAMTSGAAVNITSLSLTAGDWDVYGVVGAKGAGTTTINYWVGSISTTTGTIDNANDRRVATCLETTAFSFTALYTQQIGPARISLSGTTTIYLVTEAGFGVSTCSAYGILHARRRR